MKLERISASSFKTHKHCPQQFFIEQSLRWRFPAGKAADRGTIAHRVLEILAEYKIAQQKKENFFATAESGEISSSDDIDITKLCREVFNYQTKEVMPHHDWNEADFKECLLYVNTALTHSGGKFDPRNRNIIGSEQYIKVIPDEDWAILPSGNKLALTGFIDLVTDEGSDTIEILDWKTGRQTDFHTGQDLNEITLRDDIQLKMYHYAATKIYGEDKNYLVTIFFLKTKSPITIHFTAADLQNTKDRIREKMNLIIKDNFPKQNISWKCKKFCDFGKNTFVDISPDIKPLQQVFEGGISKLGEIMTICDQVNYEITARGLHWVEENLCKKDDKK